MQRYNPKDIEPKWQKIWDSEGTYTADLKSDKPKYIAMSMFNYPSGAGIHIGHAMNYTISDVKARFKRQQGYESYHPVGWDAFGLPAENYAIKAGVSPQESMATIIPDYHKQYKAMGWSNDWEKEISTHLPEYYKWSQWIFVQMHKHGLAYQDSRMQWFCEQCQTVLANEQVIDGKCWRHDGPDDPLVQKKEVKQWFFKITDYADELLDAIDDLDWSESVKLAQKNWIGRSEGAEISWQVCDQEGRTERASFETFTTRKDTLPGVMFIVIAPESPLLDDLTTAEHKAEVNKYREESALLGEVERQENKTKTGVFTGKYAKNPFNDQLVPIYVASYVLGGYGTGVVMGMPGHDLRDREFALQHKLPVVLTTAVAKEYEDLNSLDVWTGAGKQVNSGQGFDGLSNKEAGDKIFDQVHKAGQAKPKVNYKMRDWSVSRQRYWGAPIPIIDCPKCGAVLVPEKDLPVILPELDDYAPSGDGRSALARAKDWLTVECPKCGGPAERETDTLDTYIDSSWYMYRYFDPRNLHEIFDKQLVQKWEPIDFYNGADHATAHLLYARFIARFFKKLGLVKEAEPFKQFLFNGKVTASDGRMFSKSKGNGVDPLEIIAQGYGADALRTYMMFAAPLELWTKWDPQGVPGTHRWLSRVWNLVNEYIDQPSADVPQETQAEINRALHAMIKKMTEGLEHNRYNTAIAATMTATNDFYKLKTKHFGKSEVWQKALEGLVACIAPLAPHMSDELWHLLGHSASVHHDSWPKHDEKYLIQDKVTIAVQVNGKLRGEVQVPTGADEDTVVKSAKANEKVASHLKDQTIRKTIYVPGKLVNFVV
ncbi:leucine--tRNA ligase [Candidatus Saccharibacteria bacterium CG_4_10_14_0_2_um_filter_52_9]|nr:MAG: leucine--tRNA ligase [Candidatus Saccharibacteria bacterium CG_4_10_14_0_2_um_filter_52_9]